MKVVLPVTLFFFKILFQFKNLLSKVDSMYQRPKCLYSYFLYAAAGVFLTVLSHYKYP